MNDFLILGYYGFKNSGDDLLLKSVIKSIKDILPEAKLLILSKTPKETERLYGERAKKRDDPFAVFYSLVFSRVLLVGGGTLIQDSTSTKSLLYYLFVIRAAKLFGKKVMLFSNGIGPIKKKNEKITRKILNMTDVITLRENASEGVLRKIGVTKPEIYLTADAAFYLKSSVIGDISYIPDNNTKYFAVSVRDHKTNTPDFIKTLASVCDRVYEKYSLTPLFIPFQPSRDREISEKIRKEMKYPSYIKEADEDFSALLGMIKNSRFIIGMRLHSLIYGVMCSVPVIGLSYDIKVGGFMDYASERFCFDTKDITFDTLFGAVSEIMENYNEMKEISYNAKKKMELLSEQNPVLAKKLLKRGNKNEKK